MASRLLPRRPLLQLRLTTTPTTRSITSRPSARAPPRRRPTRTTRTTPPPHPATHSAFDDATTSPDSNSSNSPLLDPADPLSLKRPSSSPEQPTIRFFEQDISEIGRSAPRPVSRARLESDERAAEALWKKISRLEREVAELEHGDGDLDATLIRLRALERSSASSSSDGLDDAMTMGKEAEVEMLSEADPERVRAQLEALRVPGAGDAVERLNNCLRHAYLATEPRTRPVVRLELWKAYKRAKMNVEGVLQGIPVPAWDLLFYSQAVRWKSNEKRVEHVRELLEDMKSVGMEGPPTKPPGGRAFEAEGAAVAV
ncbi:uncharacterized protein BKCO1_3000017 [Diplodia corticola]|uniref:Uncharacterized protein n=1 Tax=Diplodia corticola TaxID=236234 RepID=A0A1J9QZP2_9PEZI|nr:uncharacterized protein BKCO1_3000017 [Diplodia corticola]OJD33458.1 hypothetical protein BKCO1_3000017 [Diplodia corticola]